MDWGDVDVDINIGEVEDDNGNVKKVKWDEDDLDNVIMVYNYGEFF